jgi:Tol biopolymer transport system component
MAVGFDLTNLKVFGEPSPLLGNVMQAFSTWSPNNTGAGQFGISKAGSLIYAYAADGVIPDTQNLLVWVDQGGNEKPVTDKRYPYAFPRLSHDGRRIAYSTQGREWQIRVYELDRGTNSPLTRDGWATVPIWDPKDTRLLFAWLKSVAPNLFQQPYDGSSPMGRLTTSEYYQLPGSWSSDGKTVALVEYRPDTNADIALLDTSTGRVTPFLNSQFNEACPEFSPNRRWIAYSCDESKRREVYVQDFPGKSKKIPISTEGGQEPLWARDGKQLFYRWQDQVWAVDVQTEGSFWVGKPRLLFNRPGYDRSGDIRAYDLDLNSQRFLMVKLDQRKPTPVTEMILVQNWFEELKRHVPTGKK